MVKIETIKDFEKLQRIPRVVKSYLFHYLNMFFDDYECSTLKEFGAFYFVQNKLELNNYKEFDLYQPFKKSTPEFTQIITIKYNGVKTIILHSCFLITDDYAVSIFMPYEETDKGTYKKLFEEYSEIEVTINVQERQICN